MRLPLLAFALAKRTHAPGAVGLFENGLVRDTPSRELLLTMGDPPNIFGAEWATRTVALMGLLAQGCAQSGLRRRRGGGSLRQPQYVLYRRPRASKVKLPGSGGGADIASLAQRLAIIMAHEKKRFPEHVSYVTSPGYGDGGDWRARVGLPRGGPSGGDHDAGGAWLHARDARDGAALVAPRQQHRGRPRADGMGAACRARRPGDARRQPPRSYASSASAIPRASGRGSGSVYSLFGATQRCEKVGKRFSLLLRGGGAIPFRPQQANGPGGCTPDQPATLPARRHGRSCAHSGA